jgi:syntaxin 6
MDSRARDPYYVVRDEISNTIADLRRRATSANVDGTPTSALVSDVESVEWELDELDRSVRVAERDRARFGLSDEELEERKRWGASMRGKVEELRAFVESKARREREANASADDAERGRANPFGAASNAPEAGFDDHQQLLVRRQDEDLDDISASITRIGQVGLTIGEELASQSKMLEDLEEDVDGVNARLQAAEKKMREVLKRAGLRGQLCVIFFLQRRALHLVLHRAVVSARGRR